MMFSMTCYIHVCFRTLYADDELPSTTRVGPDDPGWSEHVVASTCIYSGWSEHVVASTCIYSGWSEHV